MSATSKKSLGQRGVEAEEQQARAATWGVFVTTVGTVAAAITTLVAVVSFAIPYLVEPRRDADSAEARVAAVEIDARIDIARSRSDAAAYRLQALVLMFEEIDLATERCAGVASEGGEAYRSCVDRELEQIERGTLVTAAEDAESAAAETSSLENPPLPREGPGRPEVVVLVARAFGVPSAVLAIVMWVLLIAWVRRRRNDAELET